MHLNYSLGLTEFDCITNRFPFDWKHPSGYFLCNAIVFFWSKYAFHQMGLMIFLMVGVFMYVMTLVKDMKCKLHAINQMAMHKKYRKHMHKELIKFTTTQANIKQLSIDAINN